MANSSIPIGTFQSQDFPIISANRNIEVENPFIGAKVCDIDCTIAMGTAEQVFYYAPYKK